MNRAFQVMAVGKKLTVGTGNFMHLFGMADSIAHRTPKAPEN
jgi:hypothetical protein